MNCGVFLFVGKLFDEDDDHDDKRCARLRRLCVFKFHFHLLIFCHHTRFLQYRYTLVIGHGDDVSQTQSINGFTVHISTE